MDDGTPDGSAGFQLDQREATDILVISHCATILADQTKPDPVVLARFIVDMDVTGKNRA